MGVSKLSDCFNFLSKEGTKVMSESKDDKRDVVGLKKRRYEIVILESRKVNRLGK